MFIFMRGKAFEGLYIAPLVWNKVNRKETNSCASFSRHPSISSQKDTSAHQATTITGGRTASLLNAGQLSLYIHFPLYETHHSLRLQGKGDPKEVIYLLVLWLFSFCLSIYLFSVYLLFKKNLLMLTLCLEWK